MPPLQAPAKIAPVNAERLKRAPIWARVLRSVGSVALIVLAVEGALALAGIGEQEYLQPHPVLGFAAMPNKSITWRQEGFGQIYFNSFGMPDIERPQAKPAGTARIAVLGDSFVEALQVNRKDNFCSVLEQNLNRANLGRKFEVLNFGTSAYNVGQMYLRLKEQVRRFQPDAVIVAIRHDSVFSLVPEPKDGGMLSARPAFYLADGQLEMTNALQDQWQRSAAGKRFRLTSWFRGHSHIYGVIGTIAQDLQTQLPAAFKFNWNSSSDAGTTVASKPASDKASDDNKNKATDYYYPIEEALITSMKKECDDIGARLILVRLPRSPLNRNDFETELIRQTARQEGVPLIITETDFELGIAQHRRLFYGNHFSPEGHRLMADKLQNYILSTMGIPSRVKP